MKSLTKSRTNRRLLREDAELAELAATLLLTVASESRRERPLDRKQTLADDFAVRAVELLKDDINKFKSKSGLIQPSMEADFLDGLSKFFNVSSRKASRDQQRTDEATLKNLATRAYGKISERTWKSLTKPPTEKEPVIPRDIARTRIKFVSGVKGRTIEDRVRRTGKSLLPYTTATESLAAIFYLILDPKSLVDRETVPRLAAAIVAPRSLYKTAHDLFCAWTVTEMLKEFHRSKRQSLD